MSKSVLIKQFKNKKKEPVAGLTPEHAIYDKNGIRLDAKLGNVNLQEFRDLQQQCVNNINVKAVEAEAEIDAKYKEVSQLTQASMIGASTNGLEGSNIQDNLNDAGEKLSKLGTQVIYDVTANNNGVTFASLSELLLSENLSTLIPSEVRCGGMSIRFVQSSDNKYAQYRLMSDTFNTISANWQDIGITSNWYCATSPLKPTIIKDEDTMTLVLNSPLYFLGSGDNYGTVAAGSSYIFPHNNMYLVVSTSESEIITPSLVGTAQDITYYLHIIDRSELRVDYKVVLAYNSGRIWSKNNWASLSDNEMLDIDNKFLDIRSRINNRNFYILGEISIYITATGQYVVSSNYLDIFDNDGGYRHVRNFPITISYVQNLYLSASENSFVEPDVTTRGSGQTLYLIAAEYNNQISEKARDFLVLGHNGDSFYDPFNLIYDNNNKFVNWFVSCVTKPTVISNGDASYTITLNSNLTILGSGDNYGTVAAGSSYTLPGANNFLVLSTSENEVIDPELEGTANAVTYYIHVVHRDRIRPTTKVLAYSLREGGLFSRDNWIGLSDYEVLKLSSDVDNLKQVVKKNDYPLLPPELPIQNPLLRNSNLIDLIQSKKQDVTIIHLGDSISTNGRYSQPLPDSEAAYNPPRMDEKYLVYFIEKMLRWRGQEYRRSDAKTEKGGNTNMFTEVGTAETKYYDEAWDWQYETISQNWYNLWTRILTGTNEAPASVTFTIPAGIKRFAFIYRTDYLCANQTQVIMPSNVARIIQDSGTLVEANGYTFSMKEQDEVLTKTITSSDGSTTTRTMRKSRGQVRLDFHVDNISSEKTITIQNIGAGRLNYWGVEYTPYDKFFRYINVSRGGHNLDALKCFEEWDVDAFKPDAIIIGTPIINEGAMSVVNSSTPNTPEVFANRIKDRYDELRNKSYSPEVIPYILYIGVQANIVDQTTGRYNCSVINNYGYVDVFKYIGILDNLLKTADYPIINLFNRIDEYAHKLADSEGTDNIWVSAISGSGSTGKTLTVDTVHLNNHGSLLSFRLIKEFFNF